MKQHIEILDIYAREILDSRAVPTVEAEVICDGGIVARASVPSGASTGIFEALELRDEDKARFGGKGVKKAVSNICDIISDELVGLNVLDQLKIDSVLINMAGKNKEKLGANATLAVSLACARAGARALGVPLFNYLGGSVAKFMPVPMMNILNGGAHADNNVDIQEFMIMPVAAPSFSEALRWCSEVFYALKSILKQMKLASSVGDEGGFAPQLKDDEEGLKLLCMAIEKAGYRPNDDFKIAIDAASSEWAKGEGRYKLPKAGLEFSSKELINYWKTLCEKYPIISIEDALGEEDYNAWTDITSTLGGKLQLVGDDFFVTNSERIKMGINSGSANAVLIKPNQIGTISETADAIDIAKRCGYNTIMSHRSGETEDSAIADLAVAFGCGQIKCGAPTRSERVAKYNRLLRIEEELSENAVYGISTLKTKIN